jgi:hypothetical protein
VALATGVSFATNGCNAQKAVWATGLPGTSTSLVVAGVHEAAGYLEATLEGKGWTLDTFTPDDEVCRAMLRPGAAVEYEARGPYGTLSAGGESCRAVGLGSLREWRDRRPNQTTVVMIPRAQADYRIFWSDEQQVFLRGRFPLGSLLGFTGLDDAIAVVPNTAVCRKPIEEGVASMQYYQSGPQPLVLLSGEGQCPILALVQPLPGGRQ